MKLSVYAVKDLKSAYMQPSFEQNDQCALRNFSFAVNNPETMINFAVKDFALYRIGCYDTDTGEIIGYDHVLIARAEDLIHA